MPMSKLPARMPRRLPSKLLSLPVAAIAVLALSACGSSHTPVTHEDNTGAGGINSAYLSIGPLKYQIEISRQLNPYSVEDKDYLEGIPTATQQLPAGFLWFGVFVLVLNDTKGAQQPASPAQTFTLTDTQGDVYRPVALPAVNPYAYTDAQVQPGAQIPTVDSTAYFGPTQAALVLYKLPVSIYDNRPLTLQIVDPNNPQHVGTVTLDV